MPLGTAAASWVDAMAAAWKRAGSARPWRCWPDDPALDTLIRGSRPRPGPGPPGGPSRSSRPPRPPAPPPSAGPGRPGPHGPLGLPAPGRRRQGFGERSPATLPPSGFSGTAPATPSTPPIPPPPSGSAPRCGPLARRANNDRSETAAARVPALRAMLPTWRDPYLSSLGLKSRHDLLCDDIQQIEVIVEQVLKHDPLDSRLG